MDVMLAMSGEKRETFMHSREFPLPICRAIVFKRLYDLGYSTPRIGKFFGKDHATVLHGIKMLGNLLDIHDEEAESILSTFDYMIAKPTNNPKTMEKSYYTTVSFEGGLRKVEADLHQTIRQTFEGALVYDAHLPQLVRNFTELVEKRAAELKVKPVPVALSPFFSADMPRFLSIGRIALVLHPVRSVIGVESNKDIN